MRMLEDSGDMPERFGAGRGWAKSLPRNVSPTDAFVSARYAAQAEGSTLTSWIVRPAVAEALSKLKVETGSNQTLLQFVEDGITVAGPARAGL